MRLDSNSFEALLPNNSFAPTRNIFEAVAQESGVDMPAKLFSLPDQGELRLTAFRQVAQDVAQAMAGLNLDTRKKAQTALQKVIVTPEQRALQSPGEATQLCQADLALGG